MKKSYIDRYALYSAVEVDIGNDIKLKGWIIPKGNSYMLLPFDDIWNTYSFCASHVKDITHLTNNVKINKLAKEIEESETGFISNDTRKVFGNNLLVKDLTDEQTDKICSYMFHTYGEYKDGICQTAMRDLCKHCPLSIETDDSEFVCMSSHLDEPITGDWLKIIKENKDVTN